ncbi:DNA polymerase III subunit delta [Spongiibacter sp. KMU-158]|uniref:DNA polymerase III subunit delta n=1 Tax=Spongiibacter pelagi TaxID=2760804 RepID=A0A927C2A6_9GAMM|nr:DNA polymerase III subunit delta [Spongiibacter pelagi]MBD2858727.1 DNA polymerase III subunit delta [Spongiibacter pelagi]
MRLQAEKLKSHLSNSLLPAYLVSGDELLLVQECCDAIRRTCRDNDILEHDILEVDRYFDWNQLLEAGQNLSLFGDRKLIELRLGGAKMDQKSSAALQQYLELSDGSNILLISCERMDKRSMSSKWVKAVDEIGGVIQVWPVERRHLGGWINQRLKENGLSADREACELLADRVEGNLLAANQEIQKLKVLLGEQHINAEMVARAVSSNARYDIFKLIDAALAGKSGDALTMYHSLIAEGNEEIAMLGAISRELRNLYQCAWQIEQGNGIERVLDNARVWDNRKALYKAALRRFNSQRLTTLLKKATHIDAAQKGQSPDSPGLLFSELVLEFSS